MVALFACSISGTALGLHVLLSDESVKRKTIFTICLCASTVGSVIGFISGLSLAPVSTPLLTGIFGVVSALSVYVFQKERELGWEVATSTISFSLALLLMLLVGLDTSRSAKEYQFCLKVYADPKVTNEILDRISYHCEKGASLDAK